VLNTCSWADEELWQSTPSGTDIYSLPEMMRRGRHERSRLETRNLPMVVTPAKLAPAKLLLGLGIPAGAAQRR